MATPAGFSPKARRKARVFALQALYQWQYTHDDLTLLETQYVVANNHHRVEWSFFKELVHGVPKHLAELDALIIPVLTKDRVLSELNPIELIIIRLALFEIHHAQTPIPVAINEYVDIAHEYGTEDGYRFVNGVLDKVVKGF